MQVLVYNQATQSLVYPITRYGRNLKVQLYINRHQHLVTSLQIMPTIHVTHAHTALCRYIGERKIKHCTMNFNVMQSVHGLTLLLLLIACTNFSEFSDNWHSR